MREQQNRKIQIARNLEASDDPITECRVDAFLKLEAYAEPKDPRNISAVCTSHNLQLSRYTYAFKEEVLKLLHWYDPGQTANEIAARVHQFVSNAITKVMEGDFSRFDGTISLWLRRHIELACYRRAFGDDSVLVKLIESEFSCPAKTSSGQRYDPAGSRLSGSPLTTDGNTLIAAFVDFATLSLDHSYDEAWELMGRHYGDDSLCQGNPEAAIQVATDLGLKLKCEVRTGKVTYLGREFPRPHTSTDSFQVATRVWARLGAHTNDSHPDPIEAMCRRLRGYLATDGKTPVLGEYCRKFLQLAGRPIHGARTLSYVAANSGGAWPQSDAITFEEYLDSTELEEPVLLAVLDKIRSASRLEDLRDIYPVPPAELGGTINSVSAVHPIDVVPAGLDHNNNLKLIDKNAPKSSRQARKTRRRAPPATESPAI